jgi:plastocyanin
LANAQTANVNHVDTSPNAAVIIINRDSTTGSTIFTPTNVTVKVGEEILILNNDTAPQSFTNGNGPNDPMAGKLFDTGFIQPKQFAEYTAANVQHGTYPFFSKTNPSVKGTLTIS